MMSRILDFGLPLAALCCLATLAGCNREPALGSPPKVPSSPLPTQTSGAISKAIEAPISLPSVTQTERIDEPEIAADPSVDQETETGYPPIEKHFAIPVDWTRLGPSEIWIDRKKHQVIVGGHICLPAGLLEMFACPQHTKEHESVVAVHTSSRFVHAALLAVGAKPGTPVQFDEEYKPATGPKVKVSVRWMQDGELQEKPAQQMVRDIATREPMAHDWLFVGSGFSKQPDTDEDIYLADFGEFICVSNFGSATLDLPVESSSAAAGLLFEAFSENIPERGTLVLLVLEPDVSPSTDPPIDRENAVGVEKSDPPNAKNGK